jgi:hypothetical protein
MKIVRACDEASFCGYVESGTWPKVKLNANDLKIKERFWSDCFKAFENRGILNRADKKVVA